MPNSSAASEPTARDLQSSLIRELGRCDSRPNPRVCSVLRTAMLNLAPAVVKEAAELGGIAATSATDLGDGGTGSAAAESTKLTP
jgi:hypothetical protein